MENTVGKFIASLRKAAGMTQRELGEKLFVSDKTVSRWECGECEPELSLIPAIADIFGITADELLRGKRTERSSPAPSPNQASEGYDKQGEQHPTLPTANADTKQEKRLRAILAKRQRRFVNLSLITVGLAIAGIITAMICNLGFKRGLLGFLLACIFFAAGVICQLCFYNSARLPHNNQDALDNVTREANTSLCLITVKRLFLILALSAFCLPIVAGGAYAGLLFEFWLPYGLGTTAVAVAVGYTVYKMFNLPRLIKCGDITLSPPALSKHIGQVKVLKKCVIVCLSVSLASVIGLLALQEIGHTPFVKKQVFTDANEFKAFMEDGYDRWYEEGYIIDSDYLYPPVTDNEADEENKSYGKVKDADGNEISYYYQKYLYRSISFDEDNSLPVTVITVEDYNNGVETFYNILSFLVAIIVISFVSTACVYIIYSLKRKV